MSGKFIVFEGLDGSSKSTQANFLKDYLISKGNTVLLTKEPTDSNIGKLIRNYLSKGTVDNDQLTYLFIADRVGHMKDITEDLKKFDFVICDRYWYSNFAYQAVDNDTPYDIIDLNRIFLKPDYLFFIDTDIATCIERVNHRNEKKEAFEKVDYLKKVKENYDILWGVFYRSREKGPIIIDGNRDREKVFEDIKKYLQNL